MRDKSSMSDSVTIGIVKAEEPTTEGYVQDIDRLIKSCSVWAEEAIQQKERAERAEAFIRNRCVNEGSDPRNAVIVLKRMSTDAKLFMKGQERLMQASDGHDGGNGHDKPEQQCVSD